VTAALFACTCTRTTVCVADNECLVLSAEQGRLTHCACLHVARSRERCAPGGKQQQQKHGRGANAGDAQGRGVPQRPAGWWGTHLGL